MTKSKAIKELEAMSEDEFQTFFQSLPERTQLLVYAGLVDEREILAQWYLERKAKESEV